VSKIFAKNLKYFRVSLGLTQEELAKRVGMTRTAIANYEMGRSEPSFEALCYLTRELGIELDQLLYEQDFGVPYVYTRQVTDEEAALLEAYRHAEEVYRTVAMDILMQHRKKDRK
jgi:transcriptional regulator with XRE-family HTH domain